MQESETEREGAIAPKSRFAQGTGLYLLLTLHFPAIALGVGNGIIMPSLPGLAQSFDVSVAVASLIFIVHTAGSTLSSVPTGILIDKFGRRRVLLTGPLIAAAASVLVWNAGSFPELLLWRFIGGWGSQMWALSRLTIITDSGSTGQRGRQITSMHGVARIGTLLGPAIGGVMALAWGLRAPFLIRAVVILVAMAPSYFILRETAPDQKSRSKKSSEGTENQPDASWRTLLAHPIPTVFAALFLANLARGGNAIAGGTGPIFLYGVYAYDIGPGTIGLLTSIMALASIPILFLAGHVMDRFGRKWTIVPALGLIAGSLLFVALTSLWSMPVTAFYTAFVLLQLSTSLMGGSMQTLGSDIAPPHARGRFLGAHRMVSNSGSMGNPVSFGLLSQLGGYTLAFAFRGVVGFIAAFIFIFYVKETLKKDDD
jgi:MFS family permease